LEAEILCANGNPIAALQRLFQAHRLATRLLADFYLMTCQLNICTVQIFLGLPNTAKKTLQRDTFVKCRSSSKFLRAKLCVVTAKLGLKESFAPLTPSCFQEMDMRDAIQLFRMNKGIDYKPKEPKRPNKSQRKSEMEVDQKEDEEETTKFLEKLNRLLNYAKKVYKEYENDYLRLEVLYLSRELLRRLNQEQKLLTVEEEISQIGCQDSTLYERTCII